jgi:MFS family permease
MAHGEELGAGTVKTVPAGDPSLYAFYRDMNLRERRTFWACFMGWGLDGMDFMIYPLVIGTIMAVWHISPGEAGLATTVTLITSALGGWMAGYFSDRFGRVLTLQLTIGWFAVCTLLCAIAQNFEQLLVFRALLGIGFGGEWAAGAVLMGEIIRAEYRGRALGSVQSAWAIGWGGAVLLQAVLFTVVEPELAWRLMFLAGFVPCLLLLYYIRRNVSEPEIAAETRALARTRGHVPIWEIFAPGLLKRTVLAALAMTGAQGGYYAVNTWLPAYLQTEKGLTVVGTGSYLACLILGSFIGYLMGAWLSDRIGRRRLFLVFSVGAIATVLCYTQLDVTDSIRLFLGFPLGFFSSGYLAGVGAFLAELFPTRLRGSGQGFCYNFGRGIGSLFPLAVGFLSAILPLGHAIAIFAAGAYTLFFVAAFALPETRGTVLRAD